MSNYIYTKTKSKYSAKTKIKKQSVRVSRRATRSGSHQIINVFPTNSSSARRSPPPRATCCFERRQLIKMRDRFSGSELTKPSFRTNNTLPAPRHKVAVLYLLISWRGNSLPTLGENEKQAVSVYFFLSRSQSILQILNRLPPVRARSCQKKQVRWLTALSPGFSVF